jgi:hypothetical protein
MFLVLIFTGGCVDPRAMVLSEGNMSLKNPVTPPGIVPGTVRLVAQRLKHYATPGPTEKGKGPIVPVSVLKTYRSSRDKTPLILNIRSRWR